MLYKWSVACPAIDVNGFQYLAAVIAGMIAYMYPVGLMVVAKLPDELVEVGVIHQPKKDIGVGDATKHIGIQIHGRATVGHMLTPGCASNGMVQQVTPETAGNKDGYIKVVAQWFKHHQAKQFDPVQLQLIRVVFNAPS